jgi:hypothetical protein
MNEPARGSDGIVTPPGSDHSYTLDDPDMTALRQALFFHYRIVSVRRPRIGELYRTDVTTFGEADRVENPSALLRPLFMLAAAGGRAARGRMESAVHDERLKSRTSRRYPGTLTATAM